MDRFARLIGIPLSLAILAILAACASTNPGVHSHSDHHHAPTDALFKVIAGLDAAVFDAFNKCSAPGELQKYGSHFAPDVEFYHDTGGVTWSRVDMLANTAKHACGKYRRELVPGSLKAFPIQNYGAIAQGVHRFCRMDRTDCEGMADFVFVWRNQGGQWQVTRVLSYGHRPIAGPAAHR